LPQLGLRQDGKHRKVLSHLRFSLNVPPFRGTF
jgi:hypothetical protein